MIRQIHDSDLGRIIAAKEGRANVVAVRYESATRWDDGHFG